MFSFHDVFGSDVLRMLYELPEQEGVLSVPEGFLRDPSKDDIRVCRMSEESIRIIRTKAAVKQRLERIYASVLESGDAAALATFKDAVNVCEQRVRAVLDHLQEVQLRTDLEKARIARTTPWVLVSSSLWYVGRHYPPRVAGTPDQSFHADWRSYDDRI